MLELENVSVAYQQSQVVKAISLSLQRGDIGCLLGPSGSGKTSVLRAIAGFAAISQGEVRVDGESLSVPGHQQSAERRQIGVVFQDYALFPHLTVAENICFGLWRQPKPQQQQKLQQLLRLVGLSGMAERFIHQLSGGQQQRVALARALAPEPRLILLDEPFSGLDADLRDSLARDIRNILKQLNITAVMVTHDQHEAFAMADWIGVMAHGTLQQWGTPYQLYHQPVNRFVADFIGQGTMIRGEVLAAGEINTCLGVFRQTQDCGFPSGTMVDLLVRPDDILHDDDSPLRAKVVHRAFRGAHMLYQLQVGDNELISCLAPSHHQHQLGEMIGISVQIDDLVCFARAMNQP
ncbi:MAG: ABC transporter ATP-binding protein [Rheinheimera sp.]